MCLHSFIEYNKNLYQEQKEFTSTELQELLYKSVPVLRKLINDPYAAIVAISTQANRAMTSYLSLTSARKTELGVGKKASPPSPPLDVKESHTKRVDAKRQMSLTARQSRMTFGEASKLTFPSLFGSQRSPTPSNPSITTDLSPAGSPNPTPQPSKDISEIPQQSDAKLRRKFSKEPRPLYKGPKVTPEWSKSKQKMAAKQAASLPVPHIICDDDDDDEIFVPGSVGIVAQPSMLDAQSSHGIGDYAPMFSSSTPASLPTRKAEPAFAQGGLLARPSSAVLTGFSAPQRGPNLFITPSSANFGRMQAASQLTPTRENLGLGLSQNRLSSASPPHVDDDDFDISPTTQAPSILSRPSAGKLTPDPVESRGMSLSIASPMMPPPPPRESTANLFSRTQSSLRQPSPSRTSFGGRGNLGRQSSQRFGQTASKLTKGASVNRFGRMTAAGMSRMTAATSQSTLKAKGFYDSPSESFDIDEDEYMADNEFSRCVARERQRMSALEDFAHKMKMRFNSLKHKMVTCLVRRLTTISYLPRLRSKAAKCCRPIISHSLLRLI